MKEQSKTELLNQDWEKAKVRIGKAATIAYWTYSINYTKPLKDYKRPQLQWNT